MLYKRDWRKYDKNVLNVVLAQERWEICDDTVQNCWNDIENKLIVIVDRLAPMVEFHNNSIRKNPPPRTIQRKINCRKRLLKQLKCKPSIELKLKLKELYCKIKTFFHSQRKLAICRGITPGNTSSLWSAVKIAKDVNLGVVPGDMLMDDLIVNDQNIAQTFANFFEKKVKNIISNTVIGAN